MDYNQQPLRDRLEQLLTCDRTNFCRIFDLPSESGLFVSHYEVEGCGDRRFLCLFDSEIAAEYHNSKVSEREFAHGELVEYLDSEDFWSLNDFEYDGVFDGEMYLIVFKNRKGDSKILHLWNPEYSDSEQIQKLISLVESEVFRRPS